MKGVEALVDLVRDTETAVAVVRANASRQYNLTLLKAELEMNLTTSKAVKAGGKIDLGVSLELSTEHDSANTHRFSITLDPKPDRGKLGEKEVDELSDAILELVALRKRVEALPLSDFTVGNLGLSLHVERSTGGKLQLVAGGGGKATTSHKINLTFRPEKP
jgi:hypothetical protein